MSIVETSLDPKQRASVAELGQLWEEAVLGLPAQYRTVVMLRDIEEMSTAETAASWLAGSTSWRSRSIADVK